jgi:hypothetical protein
MVFKDAGIPAAGPPVSFKKMPDVRAREKYRDIQHTFIQQSGVAAVWKDAVLLQGDLFDILLLFHIHPKEPPHLFVFNGFLLFVK